MQRIARWTGIALGVVLALASAGRSQVERLVIGRGGISWGEIAEEIAALEDTTAAGSLQPREFLPWENVLVGPRGESGQLISPSCCMLWCRCLRRASQPP